MFGFIIKSFTKASRAARKIARYVIERIETGWRRLWRAHSSRMKSDASYAAAAAIVLGAVFGGVPVKEALAAVLAVVLGIALSGRRSYARPPHEQEVSRWNTNPDWDTDLDFA